MDNAGQPNAFSVLTIDVAPCLADLKSAAVGEIIDDVRKAYISTAFSQLENAFDH